MKIVAQDKFSFQRYTTEDGLPVNYAVNAFQDDMGFMWFGLRGACCRFDGYQFKAYSIPDTSGREKINPWISKIIQDKTGRIWIGESGPNSLIYYDPEKDACMNIFRKLNLPEQINKIITSSLIYDNNGNLWISTEGHGLLKFNPDNEETVYLQYNPDNNNTIPKGWINKIEQQRNGLIWLKTNEELCKFNPENGSYTHYPFTRNYTNLTFNPHIEYISESQNGILWAITKTGDIIFYDDSQGSFMKKCQLPSKSIKKFHSVYCISEDFEGRLWIGTNNGLWVTDSKKESIYQYNYDELNHESIPSDIVRDIYHDRSGNTWLCTADGICKLKRYRFSSYKYSSNKNSISQSKVQYIIENSSKKILLCTPVGIDVFDPLKRNFEVYLSTGSKEKRLSHSPICLWDDPSKGLWIGTFKGGLNFLNYKTNKITYYKNQVGKTEWPSNNSIFSLIIDSYKNLWIGTGSTGINVVNDNTGKLKYFMHLKSDSTTLPSNFVREIFEDSKKNIWVGCVGGIAVLDDFATGKFTRLAMGDGRLKNPELTAYDFYDTKNGKYIYIATSMGLIQYSYVTKKINIYNQKHGLPSNQICGLLEGDDGRLWVSTSNGLAVVVPLYGDNKDSIKVNVYQKSDGLQGEGFLPSSCCKTTNGTMIFGGAKGFTMFNPDSIKVDSIAPEIAITALNISDVPVKMGQKINQQVILTRNINDTKQLVLNHKNNDFSIEFAALQFHQPKKNKYAYILKGYDDIWRFTNSYDRKAAYMNLKGGNYTLYLKAANCDGVWSHNIKSLHITVLAPWWQSLWFYIVVSCALIITVYFIVRLRTYTLQKQKQKLSKIVEERTKELLHMNVMLEERKGELELQANQLNAMNRELQSSNESLKLKAVELEQMAEQLHEADQSKLRFFANISHEFRTPLTLIIAPLEKFLNITPPIDWQKLNISNQLQLMYRNAQRLLRLINQIIDFRKMEQGKKTVSKTNNNIIQFIHEIVNAFMDLAETKNIQLQVKSKEIRVKNNEQLIQNTKLFTHHSSLITQFWFDPDVMEKILYNLISNAIKYTPEGGEIKVQLRVKNEELRVEDKNKQNEDSAFITHHSSLIIEITDTGIGIKPENLDKIFDRFYRVKTRLIASQPEGAGIGLAYTKELVKIHDGDISVESEPGKGTTFVLTFSFTETMDKEQQIEGSRLPENKKYKLTYTKTKLQEEQKEETNFPHERDSLDEIIPKILEPQTAGEIPKPTVLVVEDNFDLRNFIQSQLVPEYKVIVAENGQQGLKHAKYAVPDLILSDIMMPVLDGTELCKRIKTNEITSHIPVILLTAKSGEENIIKGFETGADEYITKPFNTTVLLIRIKNILKTREQLREKFSTYPLEMSNRMVTTNSVDEEFLNKATKIVIENIENPEFNNEMYVKLMGLSKANLYRKIKALTNQSVNIFIRTIRLKVAAKLLLDGQNNVSEVAYMVGFKYRENFTRYFTDLFGESPSDYIKKYRG